MNTPATPAPTPRCDALSDSGKAHYMSLLLARTLERELAQAREECERTKEERDTWEKKRNELWVELMAEDEYVRLNAQLAAATTALERANGWVREYLEDLSYDGVDYDRQAAIKAHLRGERP